MGRGAATVATGATGATVGEAGGAVAGCVAAAVAAVGVDNDGVRAVDVAVGGGGDVWAGVAPVGVGAGASDSPQPATRSAVPPARRAATRRRVMRAGLGMRGA